MLTGRTMIPAVVLFVGLISGAGLGAAAAEDSPSTQELLEKM